MRVLVICKMLLAGSLIAVVASAGAEPPEPRFCDRTIVSGEACTRNALNLVENNRTVAAACAIYALLSHNVYRKVEKFDFELPESWQRTGTYPESESRVSDKIGLTYDVYRYGPAGGARDFHVVAVGGSDQFRDFLSANILSGIQYRRFEKQVATLLTKNQVKRIVGHSLGGGIATSSSLLNVGVEAIAFNGSPRYHTRLQRSPGQGSSRIGIYESGDIVRMAGNAFFPLRWAIFSGGEQGAGAGWGRIHYRKYDYTRGSPFKNHDGAYLAWGMLNDAAQVSITMAKVKQENCTRARNSPHEMHWLSAQPYCERIDEVNVPDERTCI